MATFIAILCILMVTPSLVLSVDIRVKGPDEVFTGDYEQFTCTISGDGVTGIYGHDWRFKFENGNVETLEEAGNHSCRKEILVIYVCSRDDP